uniref:Uncharacterized protein n=1 Tax=Latimeria chalumnae TaxID=7897 RepID=H3A1K7_LATCH
SRLSRLQQCGLTAGCCKDLSSILSTNSTLTFLNLNKNKLGDSGLKCLSAGLRHPNCKLQRLELMQCGLTAGYCKDLSSVLNTNSTLTFLNLNKNILGDSGLKHLSAGLRDSNCKLQKLWLEQCGLTAACCEDLSSVLSTNSILVELYLSRNNLGDLGVNLLSAGLRDPNCKLQRLELVGCGLTAGCCEDLSSILSTKSSLMVLNLNNNNLGDSGVKCLSAGLRDPNCELQALGLEQCGLTAGCCKDLSSVLSTNSSLMGLNLNKNNLGDSGLKCLSAGLRDPNCELQKLLHHQQIDC